MCSGAWGGTAAPARREAAAGARPRALAGVPAVVRADDAAAARRRVGRRGPPPPASVTLVGGDVHNAYVMEISLGRFVDQHSRVHQLVCSPFRNPLGPRSAASSQVTRTRPATAALQGLARLAGVQKASVRWRYRAGPTFDNSIGILELDGRHAEAAIYRSQAGEDAGSLQPLHDRVLVDGPARRRSGARRACLSLTRVRLAQRGLLDRRAEAHDGPPNATAQTANHPQPRARPAMTSDSQWRSSRTRLQATATAIPTAAPARTFRTRAGRRRQASSASAA